MKMNAFVRLIRTIACGVVVLGATNVLAQANLDATDGLGTFGTPEPQIYYPPSVGIPLTETEIPGSAYFTGPDGERIDAPTLMNHVPAGQEMLIPSKGLMEGLAPGQSFSVDGVYDGTLAFPMGTFPTTPFGERIISEVPTVESVTDEAQAAEIPGAFLDENGNPADVAASSGAAQAMENGVPVDQVVRPSNSPAADQMKDSAPKASPPESVVEAKTAGDSDKDLSSGNKQRLQAVIDELKAKLKAAEVTNLNSAKAGKKVKTIERKLKQVESRYKAKIKEIQEAKNEADKKVEELLAKAKEDAGRVKRVQAARMAADKKVEMLVAKAKQDAAKAQDKIASAEARAKAAQAEVLALTKKMATDSAGASVPAVAGIAANTAEPDTAMSTNEKLARKAKEAKAAAELEVIRKLKAMEEQKKLADAAEDAGGDKNEQAEDGKESVLSLDDQIKRLKAKRDRQIAESETRIRAKQQREIDRFLEQGKSVDSDEVKAAVKSMKEAIKTSEQKLRSRFQRRLERLKQDMKKSLK